jgi:hypothetical protein
VLLLRTLRVKRIGWTSAPAALCFACLLAFMLYMLVQALLHAASLNEVLYATTTVFLVFALALLAVGSHGWRPAVLDILKALIALSILNVVLAVISLLAPEPLEFLLVSPLHSGFGTRIAGLAGDPAQLGALLSITVLLLFVLRNNFGKRWSILLVLLLTGATIATGTRNALLSLALGCAAAMLCERRATIMLLNACAVVVLVLVPTTLAVLASPEAQDYLASQFRVDDPNAYSRLAVWHDMYQIFRRSSALDLILGGGYLYIQDIYGSPYNSFLRLFFNHGLVLVVPFLLVVATLAILAVLDRNIQRRQIVLGLLVYWFSFSMFLDTAFSEFFHFAELCFWLAAAITIASFLTVRAPRWTACLSGITTTQRQVTG